MSQATVVRIPEVLPHANADHLEIVPLDALGYRERQTIIAKGQFRPGELGILIFPGSQVQPIAPFSWLWKDASPSKSLSSFRRRLTIGVRRYRGQYSHALLMHPSELPLLEGDPYKLSEGQDVSFQVLQELEADDNFVDVFSWGMPKCTRQHMPKSVKGWVKYLLHKYYR
jgi:hypothetical protein